MVGLPILAEGGGGGLREGRGGGGRPLDCLLDGAGGDRM